MARGGAALDRAFAALAEPTRRGVVDLLRGEPRRAGDLAQALEMSPPALSRHLRVLRQSGLVEEAPLPEDGRVHLYRLRPEPFAALRAWLDEVESFWAGQLASFKAYAESPARPRGSPRSGRQGDR
jgi:DNA-binding transcriptional ArsR family regulator